MLRAPSLALVGLLLLAACSEDLEPDGTCKPACGAGYACVAGTCVAGDSGVLAAADTGVIETPDAGFAEDAVAPSDTGVHPDAAAPRLDAAARDAMVARDLGVAPDAAPPPDAGFAPDAVAPDLGFPDAAPPPDAGFAPDAAAPDTGPADTGVFTIVALTITPTAAVLVSVNGSQPQLQLTVEATLSNGVRVPATGLVWAVDPPIIGTITASTSVFTATGRAGGTARIRGLLGFLGVDAVVRVQLETVIFVGTPTTTPARFNVPPLTDAARAANILYPLNRAVMPQNVAPAEIQWQNGAANDVFRVRLEKPNVRVTAYVLQTARNAWLVTLDAWRRITQSEYRSPAAITVDRWQATTRQVIGSNPVEVRFARAALTGSIYYWDIAAGRIIRINDGTVMREAFMPSPPQGCVGCHSVSASGRYMVGRFGGGDNYASVVDLTQNLTTNPPPLLFPANRIRWWFSTWSPDDTRLAVTQTEDTAASAMRIVDPRTGTIVSVTGTLPVRSTHPAWAPDNSAIAVVTQANAWGGTNSTGNISLLPVTGRDSFGALRRIVTATAVPNDPATYRSANYPTWSPDAELIAFAHGTTSRSETGQSALHAVRPDGTGLVRLNNASGGPAGNVAFQPRFSPFEQDGYYWMTFLSKRDYGNRTAGTAGTNRQQLWITAVKVDAPPGTDPSEVPYWLPGQNTASMNISAFWAPRACRATMESCTVDAECCSGECDDVTGQCTEMTSCRRIGERCTDSRQCCNGVLCIDDICGQP